MFTLIKSAYKIKCQKNVVSNTQYIKHVFCRWEPALNDIALEMSHLLGLSLRVFHIAECLRRPTRQTTSPDI